KNVVNPNPVNTKENILNVNNLGNNVNLPELVENIAPEFSLNPENVEILEPENNTNQQIPVQNKNVQPNLKPSVNVSNNQINSTNTSKNVVNPNPVNTKENILNINNLGNNVNLPELVENISPEFSLNPDNLEVLEPENNTNTQIPVQNKNVQPNLKPSLNISNSQVSSINTSKNVVNPNISNAKENIVSNNNIEIPEFIDSTEFQFNIDPESGKVLEPENNTNQQIPVQSKNVQPNLKSNVNVSNNQVGSNTINQNITNQSNVKENILTNSNIPFNNTEIPEFIDNSEFDININPENVEILELENNINTQIPLQTKNVQPNLKSSINISSNQINSSNTSKNAVTPNITNAKENILNVNNLGNNINTPELVENIAPEFNLNPENVEILEPQINTNTQIPVQSKNVQPIKNTETPEFIDNSEFDININPDNIENLEPENDVNTQIPAQNKNIQPNQKSTINTSSNQLSSNNTAKNILNQNITNQSNVKGNILTNSNIPFNNTEIPEFIDNSEFDFNINTDNSEIIEPENNINTQIPVQNKNIQPILNKKENISNIEKDKNEIKIIDNIKEHPLVINNKNESKLIFSDSNDNIIEVNLPLITDKINSIRNNNIKSIISNLIENNPNQIFKINDNEFFVSNISNDKINLIPLVNEKTESITKPQFIGLESITNSPIDIIENNNLLPNQNINNKLLPNIKNNLEQTKTGFILFFDDKNNNKPNIIDISNSKIQEILPIQQVILNDKKYLMANFNLNKTENNESLDFSNSEPFLINTENLKASSLMTKSNNKPNIVSYNDKSLLLLGNLFGNDPKVIDLAIPENHTFLKPFSDPIFDEEKNIVFLNKENKPLILNDSMLKQFKHNSIPNYDVIDTKEGKSIIFSNKKGEISLSNINNILPEDNISNNEYFTGTIENDILSWKNYLFKNNNNEIKKINIDKIPEKSFFDISKPQSIIKDGNNYLLVSNKDSESLLTIDINKLKNNFPEIFSSINKNDKNIPLNKNIVPETINKEEISNFIINGDENIIINFNDKISNSPKANLTNNSILIKNNEKSPETPDLFFNNNFKILNKNDLSNKSTLLTENMLIKVANKPIFCLNDIDISDKQPLEITKKSDLFLINNETKILPLKNKEKIFIKIDGEKIEFSNNNNKLEMTKPNKKINPDLFTKPFFGEFNSKEGVIFKDFDNKLKFIGINNVKPLNENPIENLVSSDNNLDKKINLDNKYIIGEDNTGNKVILSKDNNKISKIDLKDIINDLKETNKPIKFNFKNNNFVLIPENKPENKIKNVSDNIEVPHDDKIIDIENTKLKEIFPELFSSANKTDKNIVPESIKPELIDKEEINNFIINDDENIIINFNDKISSSPKANLTNNSVLVKNNDKNTENPDIFFNNDFKVLNKNDLEKKGTLLNENTLIKVDNKPIFCLNDIDILDKKPLEITKKSDLFLINNESKILPLKNKEKVFIKIDGEKIELSNNNNKLETTKPNKTINPDLFTKPFIGEFNSKEGVIFKDFDNKLKFIEKNDLKPLNENPIKKIDNKENLVSSDKILDKKINPENKYIIGEDNTGNKVILSKNNNQIIKTDLKDLLSELKDITEPIKFNYKNTSFGLVNEDKIKKIPVNNEKNNYLGDIVSITKNDDSNVMKIKKDDKNLVVFFDKNEKTYKAINEDLLLKHTSNINSGDKVNLEGNEFLAVNNKDSKISFFDKSKIETNSKIVDKPQIYSIENKEFIIAPHENDYVNVSYDKAIKLSKNIDKPLILNLNKDSSEIILPNIDTKDNSNKNNFIFSFNKNNMNQVKEFEEPFIFSDNNKNKIAFKDNNDIKSINIDKNLQKNIEVIDNPVLLEHNNKERVLFKSNDKNYFMDLNTNSNNKKLENNIENTNKIISFDKPLEGFLDNKKGTFHKDTKDNQVKFNSHENIENIRHNINDKVINKMDLEDVQSLEVLEPIKYDLDSKIINNKLPEIPKIVNNTPNESFNKIKTEILELQSNLEKLVDNSLIEDPKKLSDKMVLMQQMFGTLEGQIKVLQKELEPFKNDDEDDSDISDNPISEILGTSTKKPASNEEPVQNKKKVEIKMSFDSLLKAVLSDISAKVEKVSLNLHGRELLATKENCFCMPLSIPYGDLKFQGEIIVKQEEDKKTKTNLGKTLAITLAVETKNLKTIVLEFINIEKDLQIAIKVEDNRIKTVFDKNIANINERMKKSKFYVKPVTCSINTSPIKVNKILIPQNTFPKSLRRIESII
ncbi:MAG: hypothetical protein AABZ74_06330, partial [Cyanobacteriota bacterium]